MLFRQERECQKTVQGRNFLQLFSIRTGSGRSSSSCTTEACCPAARNASCPEREQEHVCSVSVTSLLFLVSWGIPNLLLLPRDNHWLWQDPLHLFFPFSLSLLLPMSRGWGQTAWILSQTNEGHGEHRTRWNKFNDPTKSNKKVFLFI